MKENGTSLQETADFIGDYCNGLVEKYLSAKEQLSPSLGKDAAKFIDSMGSWIIGNLVWVFIFTLKFQFTYFLGFLFMEY